MKKIMFISDLDGTLLEHGGKVIQADLDAIKGAGEHVTFCVATGRHMGEVLTTQQLHKDASYLITSNGNEVYEIENEKPKKIYSGPTITHDIAKEALEIGERYAAYRILSTSEAYLCENIGDSLLTVEKIHGLKHDSISSILTYMENNADEALKMLFIMKEESGQVLCEELQHKLGDRADVVMSNQSCVELSMKGVTKGNAIHFLQQHLKDDRIYVCVGDNDNDRSMVKVCHYSFAMQTGLDSLKKEATETVQSVGHAVERMTQLTKEHKVEILN